MMQSLLITGGDGFIARHCKEYFKDRYRVFAPNKYELNLMNFEELKEWFSWNHIDYVIHTAVYDAQTTFGNKDKNKVFLNNMQMFMNLARLQNSFDRMIYFGSGAETHMGQVSNSQYSLAKQTMTKYIEISENNIFNLRLFGVMGEFADWRYRIPENLICKAIYDMPLYVPKNKMFSYIDVIDLMKIINLILEKKELEYKTYNCVNSNLINYQVFIDKLLKLSHKKLKIDIKSDYILYEGNNTNLINEFPELGFTELDDTIGRLLNYYLANKDKIDINKFEY